MNNVKSALESNYTAKLPDKNGIIAYTPEEDETWKILYERQIEIVKDRACEEYLKGLEILNLPKNKVPQCQEISAVLQAKTGWSVVPVPALISPDDFFHLIAHRQFPAASFVRRRDELDYLKEPDIFHEVFGHCPLLTQPVYADFVQAYGQLGLKASESERTLLARLFWFTIEFGLIQTAKGLKVYGAGILSSKEETIYALESPLPKREPFEILQVLRTPYRFDMKQLIYFIISHYQVLFDLIDQDLLAYIHQAQEMGEHPSLYPLHAC